MKILTMVATILGILLLTLSARVAAKQETFFGCESGFQYESKKNAARCIKQQKQTFRPPLKCQRLRKGKGNLRLVVDSDGLKDRCEVVDTQISATAKATSKARGKRHELQLSPPCMAGYKLHVRKGKDACAKGNAEQIKPPTKKVTR